jgi:hypothetical protein
MRIAAQGADPTPRGRPVRGPVVRLEQTQDRQTNAFQRSFDEATAGVRKSPIVDGNLIVGLKFTAMIPLAVAHRLGRAALGYIFVRSTAYARFRQESQLASLDSKQITLSSDATCTVDVWVF